MTSIPLDFTSAIQHQALHLVEDDGRLHCFSIFPFGEDGEIAGIMISYQTRTVLRGLQRILEEAGSQLDLVVKTGVYLSDIEDMGCMNDVYGAFFCTHRPARACLATSELPEGVFIGMDAIARL